MISPTYGYAYRPTNTTHFSTHNTGMFVLYCLRRQLNVSFSRFALFATTAALAGTLSSSVVALSREEWVSAFVRFVEWPVPAATIDGPLVVCQHRDAPALALNGQRVRGVTLAVRRVARLQQLTGCHIYAAFSDKASSWTPWLQAGNRVNLANVQKGHPAILMIGMGGQYCDLGGAICLVTDSVTGLENYRLNLDTLARAGFRVDTQLLRAKALRTAKAE